MNNERQLVKQFDKDGSGWLNNEERKTAREWIKEQNANRRFGGPGGFGGFGGPPGMGGRGGETDQLGQPGRKLTHADVKSYPTAPIYDPFTIRTFVLEFENADWESELADFKNTDVEVPAKVTVDGRTYRDVGVHFRGGTSYMFAGQGRKRPLNLAFDFVHKDQNFGGYRTFNFLNSNEDPSFLRAVLYLEICRHYIPAAKANFVRVFINGESWGVYPNIQQVNKEFVAEWYGTTKGTRWKVPGSPGTRAGLEYFGDDLTTYKRLFNIKSKDSPEVWADLIKLCRTLNETDLERLPQAIEPILDVDGVLRFLALDLVLINNDGYWTRSSDYNIYLDKSGRFHLTPHDINETFAAAGGPGFGGPGGPGGMGGGGVELEPLVAVDDTTKPLRSRLLAVPQYRARYLGYVREIADTWLNWERLGPIAKKYHDLIADDVKTDTRKLDTTEAFLRSLDDSLPAGNATAETTSGRDFWRRPERINLKMFAHKRRAFLLNHAEVKAASAQPLVVSSQVSHAPGRARLLPSR